MYNRCEYVYENIPFYYVIQYYQVKNDLEENSLRLPNECHLMIIYPIPYGKITGKILSTFYLANAI